ncbi:hypothetical protein [Bacillus sp. JZ34]
MHLMSKGLVELGDPFRVSDYENGEKDGAIIIGGVDVINALKGSEFNGKVTVGVMDETFDGDLFIETGWGYSEWTPVDPDKLCVGSHDIINIVSRYEGQSIKLVISDEPIDILADSDPEKR